jgi:RNA polymerase sigma factor for flagellar operon FliA
MIRVEPGPQTADASPVPPTPDGVEALVTSHLALVGHLTRETAARMPRHLGTDDLAGAGALALVQAAHAFDHSLGVPFARFAAARIRGAMIDQMRQRTGRPAQSRSAPRRGRRLGGVAGALHRQPTDAELAAASGLTGPGAGGASGYGPGRCSASTRWRPMTPVWVPPRGRFAAPRGGRVAAERIRLRDAIAELPERLRHVVTAYYLQQRPLTGSPPSSG